MIVQSHDFFLGALGLLNLEKTMSPSSTCSFCPVACNSHTENVFLLPVFLTEQWFQGWWSSQKLGTWKLLPHWTCVVSKEEYNMDRVMLESAWLIQIKFLIGSQTGQVQANATSWWVCYIQLGARSLFGFRLLLFLSDKVTFAGEGALKNSCETLNWTEM